MIVRQIAFSRAGQCEGDDQEDDTLLSLVLVSVAGGITGNTRVVTGSISSHSEWRQATPTGIADTILNRIHPLKCVVYSYRARNLVDNSAQICYGKDIYEMQEATMGVCRIPLSMPFVAKGLLIADNITHKIFEGIQHGKLLQVHAIVVHQTGGSTAKSAFASYGNGKNGAHFLIDKFGIIYQTARVDQICWHVGKIKSRCEKQKNCSSDDIKSINKIMHLNADSYSTRLSKLHKFESKKNYPERYPTNNDSIGIELVGAYDEIKGYEKATDDQNNSLRYLVGCIEFVYRISNSDVFRHPELSRKQDTEAESAQWK